MQANENLGDYKLKSSEDYTGEKITAAVRRKRVIDMKLKVHCIVLPGSVSMCVVCPLFDMLPIIPMTDARANEGLQ